MNDSIANIHFIAKRFFTELIDFVYMKESYRPHPMSSTQNFAKWIQCTFVNVLIISNCHRQI